MSSFRVHILRVPLLFVLVGPFLAPIALAVAIFVTTGEIRKDPLGKSGGEVLTSMLGFAMGWWLSLLAPPLWPTTWVPTMAAGLFSGVLLWLVLGRTRRLNRRKVVVISAAICGSCSAATYAYIGWDAAIFGTAEETLAATLVGLVLGVVAGAWPRIVAACGDQGAP